MRTATTRKAQRGRQVSTSYSLPAPTGGLNARDSITAMSELDALVMENAFPETTDVRVRKGYSQHATGLSNAIESIMPYNASDGTQTLFCASGDGIYNVSSSGAVGAAVQSSLSNSRFQSVNFSNSAATSYLCCFNGEDSPRYWNGSAWITVTGASSPAITGITTTDIISGFVHKRRLHLVLNNSLKVYYLPVDSVGGAVNEIDLGGIASKGGYVVAGETWTLDAGVGVDDFWACITSEGELVVYAGTDPSSSSTWEIKGVWNIGEPIGRRCLYKYQGDLLAITTNGVVSISKVLLSGSVDDQSRITDKISSVIAAASAMYKANFGWQLMFFPQGEMLLLNVPVGEGSKQEQYAMNTVTGMWGGPFKGLDANCWAMFNKEPYFGGSTTVNKFWGTDGDNLENITFSIHQAYSALNSKGALKQVKAIRPFVQSAGSFKVLVSANTDYSANNASSDVSFSSPGSYGAWGSAIWGSSLWSGGLKTYRDWQNLEGIGSVISLQLDGEVSEVEFRYQASDFVYETGGIIG